MAKKRDMYEQLAKRRSEKIPIRTTNHVKEFHVHLLPPKDVRETRPDGSKGKIKKVTSVLYCRAKFAGFNEGFESETVLEVDEKWTVRQEMEKGIRSAVFSAIEFLTKKCEAALAAKEGKEPEPEPELFDGAENEEVAPAEKGVKNG